MSKEKQTRVLSRRGFLRTVTGAAAGAMALPYIVPSSVFGADGAVAPSNRLLVGVIGMGSQGGWDMRGFFSEEDSLVVAVCDVDKRHQKAGKAEVDQRYGNSDCKMYLDFREVIARSDIDIVSIAVPDHWHSIPAIMAAQAGKDIYGQKPMARTIREGRAICDAVKRYGTVWQTGSWQRSIYNFRRACELVRNGRIGKVHTVEVGLPTGTSGSQNNRVQPVPEGVDWDLWLGPAPYVPYRGVLHWDWRWIMDYSGGQLTDWAGHHIDIAHWALDLERTGPVEVEGVGKYPTDGMFNVPYEYKVTTKYANGLTMIIANDKQVKHGMGTCWYGDKGWIHVTREDDPAARGNPLQASDPKILDEVIGPNEIHLYKSIVHHRNFLDCIKTRRETITPAEIAHRSLTPALLGEIAMQTGRKLRWDPDKEVIIGDEEASKMLSRPMRSPWHLYM
jgi:predicted dehydrogenase